MMRQHIIPVNIADNGNLGNGLLKKRNVYEAAGVLIVMFFIFKALLFAVPMLIKTVLFIIFAGIPAAVCLIGIGDESVIEAILTYRTYKKQKAFLPYSMAAILKEDVQEKEGRKEAGRRRKHEKRKGKASGKKGQEMRNAGSDD